MSDTSMKLYASLVKARKEFKTVVFDKTNPHFKNKFASLAAINEATLEALGKYGLAIIQPWEIMENGDTKVETWIIHESGEHIKSSCLVKSGKTDQQFGSSVTYMRRYQAASMLGVVGEEDDDGEIDRQSQSIPISSHSVDKKQEALPGMITEKQQKMLYAMTNQHLEFRENIIKTYGSLDKVPYNMMQKLLDRFKSWKEEKEKEPVPKNELSEEESPF